MADPEDEPIDEQQPDQAALAVVARHALHDEELIAAFAGGDMEPGEEVDRARALTERCSACRDLNQDVQLIDSLIRAADTAAEYGARVSAPRDFRLTVDDARRLGGPVPVEGIPAGGLLDRLRAALTGLARPLGASMATLGFVGLLVGSMTFGSGAMPVAVDNGAPTGRPAVGELTPAGASAPDSGVSATGAGANPTGSRANASGFIALSSGSTADPERSGTNARDAKSFGSAASSGSVLQAGSFALLLGGLALLLLGLRGRGRRRE